jgi:hypothetical protein
MPSSLNEQAIELADLASIKDVTILLYKDGQPTNLDWLTLSTIRVTNYTEDEVFGMLESGTKVLRFDAFEVGLKPDREGNYSTRQCTVPSMLARPSVEKTQERQLIGANGAVLPPPWVK